jgi:hypothetical protein
MSNLPNAKVPDIHLPTIRLPIPIPRVGCPGSDARSYIGEQFGSLPDLYDALHIKHLRTRLYQHIYTLLKGQLPTVLRAPLYYAQALDLIQHIAELVEGLNQVIGHCIAEYNATIAFINMKKAEINGKLAEVNAIPESACLAVNRLQRQRYQEYLGELDRQITKLTVSINCIAN